MIFANELSVFAIEEEKTLAEWTMLADTLIKRVVFVSVGFAASQCAGEFSASIPGKGGLSIVLGVARCVIGVVLSDWPRYRVQAVTIVCDRVRIGGAAGFILGTITIGVIAPDFEAGVVRLVCQSVVAVIVKAAVIDWVSIGCLRDPASCVVVKCTCITAD